MMRRLLKQSMRIISFNQIHLSMAIYLDGKNEDLAEHYAEIYLTKWSGIMNMTGSEEIGTVRDGYHLRLL